VSQKLSDIATRADWSFLDDESNAAVILDIARNAAGKYEHLEEDDTFQELCLYVAVRPAKQVNQAYIVQCCQTRIRDLARQARTEADREPSYEKIFSENEERWD